MSDVIDSGWRFNKNYRDYSQVEAFLPSFMARLQEIEAAGKYRYNASFKGHLPGVEGPDEDAAIYMLQNLERWNAEAAKEAALVADGYEYVTELPAVRKFAHIVLVRTREMGEGWAEYRDARLLPSDGKPDAILPKGKRTYGHRVSGRKVLVKP